MNKFGITTMVSKCPILEIWGAKHSNMTSSISRGNNSLSKVYFSEITIDLFYFWDVYDVNLWEKISVEVALIHAEQMSLYNFIVLRKNNRHSWRLSNWSKTFQINGNLWVFLNWNRIWLFEYGYLTVFWSAICSNV